jgi:hypothetical protein
MSEKFSESVGKVVGEYTWLVVDALLLLFLLASTLAYKDFDEPMKVLFRGVFVAFWGYVWISGLHVLIYLRVTERNQPMPGVVSYSLFTLKLALIVGVAYWAHLRGLL